MSAPVKTDVDLCNAALDSVFAGGMQHLLDNVQPAEKKPWEVYPISAMPIVGGDYSVVAEAVAHRSKAVKLFNGLTEVWIPRSQIRRFVANTVVVSEWIVTRKSQYFARMENRSPEYQAWLERRERESKATREWLSQGGGFQYKFDGRV